MINMAVSKHSIRNLEKAFENIFESDTGQIGDSLLYNDVYTYGEIVHVALMDEGYPENASYRTVGTSLEVKSKVGYEDWANQLIEDGDINDSEEVDTLADNDGELINCILNHLDRVDIDVEFIDSIEDYIDSEPSYDFFEDFFEKEYDEVYFKQLLEYNMSILLIRDDYFSAYQDAKREQIDNDDVDDDDITVGIVQLNLQVDTAEILYNHYNEYSVSDYMGSDVMYDDIVMHGLIDPEFELEYDLPEENDDPDEL